MIHQTSPNPPALSPVSYEPLHHKYRPQTFAHLVGQEAIATTLINAIRTERIAPAYLFTGPRGTGKTSSARILAKSLNCKKQPKPTESPCGVCEVCTSIASGSALDVIEIDAASNTGVDNIRDIIERAQFAPAQCRYKVYVIDECLTGDSLVQTSEGLIRIDEPNIKGKKVLSYNDASGTWEFKKVVRWLDQGVRQTLVIKTTNREIRCTGNHLIRTEAGWIAAKNVKEGVRILSPVNVDAEPSFTNLGQMDSKGDLLEVINSRGTNTELCLEMPALLTQTQPGWVQTPVENGWWTSSSIQSPQWITSLERVESVTVAGVERVYDIEVEDNHNFVANGLLVHNCHMLSVAAFNSLLKTLEEPPKHVVFVLATTDPQRVLPTIISRCQRFDFRRIPLEAMVGHLRDIAAKENINITLDAVTLVAQVAQGGLRDAESLLDQLSLLVGEVTVERVWDLVGAIPERDLMALTKAIASDDSEAVLDHCRRLMDRGREPLIVLQNLAGFYRDLLIARTAANRSDLVAVTPPTWKELCEFAKQWDVASILQGQQHLKNSEAQIKNTTQPRLWLEVTLLGLLPSAQVARHEQASSNVSAFKPSSKNQPQTHKDSTPQVQQPTSPVVPKIETATNGIQSQEKPAVAVSEASLPSSGSPQPDTEKQTELSIPAASNSSDSTPKPDAQLSTAGDNIDQIWQQVLAHLQPISTRELLRQLGRLIGFDSHSARLSIPPAWREKIQEKVPNIEAAFQDALNCNVKVILEGITTKSAKTTLEASAVGVRTSDRQAVETTATPASYTPSNKPRPEAAVTAPTTNVSPGEQVRQLPSERVNPVGGESRTWEHPPATKEPQAREELNRGSFHSTSSPSPGQTAGQHLYEVERTITNENFSSQFSTPDTRADVHREQFEHPQGMPLQTFQTDVTAWDAEQVEKAIVDLKQFFEGEIIDLTDDFQVRESIRQEASEELGWIKSEKTYSMESSEMTEPDNVQADALLEDWPEDDRDDIPF